LDTSSKEKILKATSSISCEWAACIQEIAEKKEAALSKLYVGTLSKVYGAALRITRNSACAEEVVGDVFFQVWRTAASFNSERGSPIVWLLMITRSLALGKLRTKDIALSYADMDPFADEITGDSDNPQSQYIASEQNSTLLCALQTLDARERQLLVMAFFHSLTHTEIASQLKMPIGTVKTCLRRGLLCLHKRLKLLEMRG
jgi:RNA polymerase sigma-70 factor (ECF subfamily)